MKSIEDQIAWMERVLAARKRVYPKMVAEEKLDKRRADHEIETMESILETLRRQKQPSLF